MFKTLRRRALTAAAAATGISVAFIPQAAAGDFDQFVKDTPVLNALSHVVDILYPLYGVPLALSTQLGITDVLRAIVGAILPG
ncbi:hypothetical protein [Corynebacterium freiburgense]|uniref:hypothetical protein n=1 Tax=Corynebacterium freiburgense TaxID=556548 RepID=UPI00041E7C01|nr:hypothetical protein [Corynebacterium freiburgense]WJZ01844.1 hypothetical protein CFREI_02700 [Corynebacterium freiburgense]